MGTPNGHAPLGIPVLHRTMQSLPYPCTVGVPSLGVLFWLRRNVRHAFFQPAENEMITLVHFRLHNPIMVRLPAIGLQHPEFYF